jgi:hypothetical protein
MSIGHRPSRGGRNAPGHRWEIELSVVAGETKCETAAVSSSPPLDTGMLVGIDHECAADPERARWGIASASKINVRISAAHCTTPVSDAIYVYR